MAGSAAAEVEGTKVLCTAPCLVCLSSFRLRLFVARLSFLCAARAPHCVCACLCVCVCKVGATVEMPDCLTAWLTDLPSLWWFATYTGCSAAHCQRWLPPPVATVALCVLLATKKDKAIALQLKRRTATAQETQPALDKVQRTSQSKHSSHRMPNTLQLMPGELCFKFMPRR